MSVITTRETCPIDGFGATVTWRGIDAFGAPAPVRLDVQRMDCDNADCVATPADVLAAFPTRLPSQEPSGGRSSHCGNPNCPEQPEIIPDDSGVDPAQRPPCPVCGSKARVVRIAVHAHAGLAEGNGQAFDASPITSPALPPQPASRRRPQPLPPRRGRSAEPPWTTEVQPEVVPSRPLGSSMLSIVGLPVTTEYVIRYADLQPEPDAPCIFEICTLDGQLLSSGAGLTPADALSVMFEQMLPPSSSERVDPDDLDRQLDDD
jgi:hypothetical protein